MEAMEMRVDVIKKFNQLIGAFKRARRRDIVAQKTRDIMDFYENNKQFLGNIDFYYLSTSFPTKLWLLDIQDSFAVSQYLSSITTHHYRFHKLISLDINSQERDDIHFDVVEDRTERSTSCLDFFLTHAKRARLLVDKKRITDLTEDIRKCCDWNGPILSIDDALLHYPQSTITMLQHGARFFEEELDPLNLRALAAMFLAFSTRLADMEISWHEKNGAAVADMFTYHSWQWKREQYPDGIRAMAMIVMSLRNPQLATYLIAGYTLVDDFFEEWCPHFHHEMALPEIEELVSFYDMNFPGWNLGRLEPPLLKHICRHQIRGILNNNWQLPDGSSKLGLPAALVAYLNLWIN